MTDKDRKTRVLHVLPWVASGGVERRRKSLAEFLPDDEFEQRVFCLGEIGPLANEIRALGVPVHEVGRHTSIREPKVYWQLGRLIRDFRPDIIHGAVFEGVRMAVTMGSAMRVPHVIVEETSHATNRSKLGHLLFGFCSFIADRCVAISPAVAAYLEEHSHVPAEKICTIPNGVPIPEEVPPDRIAAVRRELGVDEGDVLFVTVGRLYDDSHKRVSDLIKAVASDAFELDRAKVAVVGEGPIRGELESLARELGVAEQFVFTGYRHDVDAIYAASDVFLLASGREGFGLVVAEAMMHGLPTLTTTVGGIGDIVVHDETGLTFEVADVDTLAGEMMRLGSDATLRERLGKEGKKRANAHFSSQRYAYDVASLYRSLVRSEPVS